MNAQPTVTRVDCPLLNNGPKGTACACWGGCTIYVEISTEQLRAEKKDAAREAVTGLMNEWPEGLSHPSAIRRYLRDRLERIDQGGGFFF